MTAQHHITASIGSDPCNTMAGRLVNLRLNRLGMVAFDGKFSGMEKTADFVLCKPGSGNHMNVTIQSEKRVGWITMFGDVYLTHELHGGAFAHHLPQARRVCKLNAEDLFNLKNKILMLSVKKRSALDQSAKVAPMFLVD